jgi:hypothetical protein
VWASSAVLVLIAFVTLESQSWVSRASGSQYKAVTIVKPMVSLLRNALARKSVPTVPIVAVPKQLGSSSPSATALQMPETPRHQRRPTATDQSSLIQTPKPDHTQTVREWDSQVSTQEALLQRAANRSSDAKVALANAYLEGKGAHRNCEEAIALLEAAAARSNVRAQNHLAGLYVTGSCVPRDRVQAYHWLKAALATDPENQWTRQNLDLTWRQMTAEERNVLEAGAQ